MDWVTIAFYAFSAVSVVSAGAVISVVPLIGVFIIGSRHFIANIAAGALKG